jgi:SpoU rRNA methylase family enzyme
MLEAFKPISKALAGAVAGAIVLFMAKYNIIIADDLNDAIEVLISAIITAVIVYAAPKNEAPRS